MTGLQCGVAQWLAHRLPSQAAYACAELLADFKWRLAGRDRAAVRSNLSLALGAALPAESPLMRQVFRNFGRYLVEFFTIHRRQEPVLAVEGGAHLAEAHRSGRGALLLSAHLGNWELGAIVTRRMGFPVAVVALPHPDPGADRVFNFQRERCGVSVIPLGLRAAGRSLEWLRAGGLLGVLGDFDFVQEGQETLFCGRRVALPRGPAVLSLRSQAPVVPVYLVREGTWSFRLCVEPPIWPPKSADGSATAHLTRAYAGVLERYVRRFPDQWLLFQDLVEVSAGRAPRTPLRRGGTSCRAGEADAND